MRLPTYGGLFAWEFEREGHELRLRVEEQSVVNHDAVRLDPCATACARPM
jgi:hypothetical protein